MGRQHHSMLGWDHTKPLKHSITFSWLLSSDPTAPILTHSSDPMLFGCHWIVSIPTSLALSISGIIILKPVYCYIDLLPHLHQLRPSFAVIQFIWINDLLHLQHWLVSCHADTHSNQPIWMFDSSGYCYVNCKYPIRASRLCGAITCLSTQDFWVILHPW